MQGSKYFLLSFLPPIVINLMRKPSPLSLRQKKKHYGFRIDLNNGFLITFKDLLPGQKNQILFLAVWVQPHQLLAL